jgi:hypothetical protein
MGFDFADGSKTQVFGGEGGNVDFKIATAQARASRGLVGLRRRRGARGFGFDFGRSNASIHLEHKAFFKTIPVIGGWF